MLDSKTKMLATDRWAAAAHGCGPGVQTTRLAKWSPEAAERLEALDDCTSPQLSVRFLNDVAWPDFGKEGLPPTPDIVPGPHAELTGAWMPKWKQRAFSEALLTIPSMAFSASKDKVGGCCSDSQVSDSQECCALLIRKSVRGVLRASHASHERSRWIRSESGRILLPSTHNAVVGGDGKSVLRFKHTARFPIVCKKF